MPMRMSGLMSGMDTESIISQLVEARSVKVNTAKKAQTKLSWTQDAWKSLNTKLKNLQSKFLSNMRFQSSYSKKVTKVSNSSAVSVITGENAVNGVQSLEVNHLAKTGYLTGAELKARDADGNPIKGNYDALTSLSQLGFEGSATFTIRSGGKDYDIHVKAHADAEDGENTTISDVLNKMKEAGLNAAFDTKSQRLFISSKDSGTASDFSITASDDDGSKVLAALGLQTEVSEKADKATYDRYLSFVEKNADGKYRAKTTDEMGYEINSTIESKVNAYFNQYKSLQPLLDTANESVEKLKEKYGNLDLLESAEYYEKQLNGEDGKGGINAQIAELMKELQDTTLSEAEKTQKENDLEKLNDNSFKVAQELEARKSYDEQRKLQTEMDGIEKFIEVSPHTESDGTITYSVKAKDLLKTEVNKAYNDKADYAADVLNGTAQVTAGATKVSGQDAEITLNGATFTNNTNVFEINGLTFTALSETKPGESITVTTEQDTDGIYDMVKNFLKEYNSIINEIDRLYNADSAKGYEPLTDDEKKAMSDSEVEKYEKKIKDALLRRDSNLSDIRSGLTEMMASGFEVNGKKMYLSDFGINTLGYFTAPDNEKNAYHIDGDSDDGDTAGNADKLKSMIAGDPDTVIAFFTKLSQSLYSKMSDLSKSVDGYRSFGNFYDDKKMKEDYVDYTSKISELEKKLNDYEDKWYKKFSKMETAMAKMQSNASAVTGLLGGQ